MVRLLLIIKAYGGSVHFTPKADGVRGAIAETECLAEKLNAFLPRQFANLDNAEAHRHGTAREVVEQCRTSTDVDADGRRQTFRLELQRSLLTQAS